MLSTSPIESPMLSSTTKMSVSNYSKPSSSHSLIFSIVPHEFIWRHGGNRVLLTGTFDNWSKSIQMTRQHDGTHRVIIKLDSNKKWLYKFVIDGEWRCTLGDDTEKDERGNVNNVLLPEEYK